MNFSATTIAKGCRKHSSRRILATALLLAAIVYLASPTPGCGPFLPDAIFSYAMHPDFPLVKFARGELGILQPSYARSYLVVAYRNAAGVPLSDKEQQAALNLWQARLTSTWYPGRETEQNKTKIQEWLELRKTVPGTAAADLNGGDPVGITHSASQPYQNYYNCLPDAFAAAGSTFQARIAKFGGGSGEVKSWLAAQDEVFANCADRPANSAAVIPAAAAPGENPLIRSDRAYQIAAASFYSEDFPKAEAQFTEIANDKNSPWSKTAKLLMARTYIREATLGPQEAGFNYEPMAKAEAQLKSILADKELAEIHPAAERLLGFVEFRLHPRERLLELAANLSRKNGSSDFEQDLWDYTMLLDSPARLAADPTLADAAKPTTPFQINSLEDLRASSEMTDWVLTMQSAGASGATHAVERWNQMHSSVWLVAAIAKIPAQDPQAAAIDRVAASTSSDSPSFATITFHHAQILMNSGQQDAAREALDRALETSRENFPPSSLNLILAQRLRLARSYDEFLRFAPRDAAGIVTFNGELEIPDDKAFGEAFSMNERDYHPDSQAPLFDADSVRLFNRQIPVGLLKEAASTNALPENLRAQIAPVAWTRAVLLDDDAAERSLAPIVASRVPALKAGLEKIAAEKTKEGRHFAAIFLLLQNPGLRPNATVGVARSEAASEINQYRDNWWCAALERDLGTNNYGSAWAPRISNPLEGVDSVADFGSPSFLRDAQKQSADAEWRQLVAAGAGPDYLTREVLAWAKSHPADERVPEALHLAIRSTRYGCTTTGSAKLSKEAFDLLHSKYPKSPWAAKTKYWYGAN